MCHVTFSISRANRNLGSGGGHFFKICIMSLAVGNRERSTGINDGIHHPSELLIA